LSGPAPVSAVLITENAEEHLDRVLGALRCCDEIVVLDSGSTDRTREIASEHRANWYERPFDGYGSQKRHAVVRARFDWILAVDADEVLDEDARAAVTAIDWERQDPSLCWRLRRRPFVGRREIRYGHWNPDWVVRLFHRGHHDFSNVSIHESVAPTAAVRTLPGSLMHLSYRDVGEIIRMDYHRLKASRYRDQGRRASGPTLAVRATWAFLYSYVIRRGFLDGPAGVVIALAGAVNAVMGLALASEEREERKGEEGKRGGRPLERHTKKR
jgi:glycosyltransferase involved in cell wall biosynthesis